MSATGTTVKNKGMKRKERDSDKFFEFIESPPITSHAAPATIGAEEHGEESGDGQAQGEEGGSREPHPQPSSCTREGGSTMIEAACAGTVESLAAIVRPPLIEMMGSESLKDGLCQLTAPLHPEEELRNIRSFVGTIAHGIGQLQHTLQRSQTQWHFNRIVGQLSQLSQELTGQVEQTASLYTLLQNHNCLDEMNRKGASYAGFFSVLPEECTLQVLSFLSERDLANVALLNRQFKRLAEDDAIWRLLSMRRWKKARDKGKDKANKRRRHAWREYFIGRRRIDANWQEGTYALRTLTGHDNQLYCVQFDEDKIVSGSEDETMKVWDIASGKCLKTLKGHTSGVWCLQFWHDRLLSGSEDSTIRLWNLETGKCEHILNGHRYGVWSLQFDDSLMVSGAEDQAIKLWDMNTLQCTNTLLGHKSDIWCLQFDAAQQMIVSGSGYEDRTLKLWDMRTGSCVMTMAGHLGAVNSLCVFYASQSHPHCILSGSADQTIKVWDRRMGLCEATLEGHQGEVLCMKMADSRNPRIVSGGGSTCKTIKVWKDWYSNLSSVTAKRDRISLSLSGHDNGVWGLQYDEDKIMSGSADKTIKIWDFSCVVDEEQHHQEHVEGRGGEMTMMMGSGGGESVVVVREEEDEHERRTYVMETDDDGEEEDNNGGGGQTQRVIVQGKRKREEDDDESA